MARNPAAMAEGTSRYSSGRFGPKAWVSPPGSCFPQDPGSLMWVPALADTMKRGYVPLPGCSTQGVNPKSARPWGEEQPQHLLERCIKPQMKSGTGSPLISSRGSPGALSISRL